MKFSQIIKQLTLLAICLVYLSSCDSTTTPSATVIPVAPTNLQAVSLNDSTIQIMWTASTSESDTTALSYYHVDYQAANSTNMLSVKVTKDATTKKFPNTVKISGLKAGTIYNFMLMAANSNNDMSSSVKVTWSPSFRFDMNVNDQDIKVYETASAFGSGLQIFKSDEGAPKTLKTTSGADWNCGLFTTGKTIFGSASKLGYASVTPTVKTEFYKTPIYANSLNDAYDSKAMNSDESGWGETTFDLSVMPTNNMILWFRVQNGTDWNYGKMILMKNTAGFLSGTSPDQYVAIKIAYQKTAGVPYARFK